MQDPAVGKEVDGYRILDVLGRGGMGVVYQAEDVALSRTVAIKRIDPALANDEAFLRRFRSEARALARIDSPYIVSVHALRKTDLGLLIVMEYVDGGTLKDQVNTGPMEVERALPVIRQMLTALEHAHGAGVIHRDIKPHNIMLTEAGRVKVTDFGLAKVHRPDAQGTVTQGVYGTLNYMSPEQVQGLGQVDKRSDLYSLGMTIYEMLAGQLPFDDDSGEFSIMRTIVEEELPPPDRFRPDLPDPLVQLVMKTLEKDPEQRFQSAAEMRRALDAFDKKYRGGSAGDDGSEVETSPASSSTGGAGFRRAGVIAALVLVLGTGGYVAYSQFTDDDTERIDNELNETPSSVTTTLSVATEPAGAAVSLDGRDVGRTPLLEMPVADESVALRLQMSGYRTVDTTLYVAEGTSPSLDVQLEAVASETEMPEEDEGPASSEEIVANADDDAADMDDASGETAEPTPPARGTLDLNVDPEGTIYVDGEEQGLGPVDVPVGQRQIRFQHPEYGAKDTTVTVAEGETLSLNCYFEQTITVNHEVAWGNVWINGSNTGESTPHTFTRGPGTYRVELRIQRDGFTISEGQHNKSVGGQRSKAIFSGNAKTITIEPTFAPTRHALTFQAVDGGTP